MMLATTAASSLPFFTGLFITVYLFYRIIFFTVNVKYKMSSKVELVMYSSRITSKNVEDLFFVLPVFQSKVIIPDKR